MAPDPHTVTHTLELLSTPENLNWLISDRVLLDKDDNKRVEILVARGLQCIYKLARATNPQQIIPANKIFIAEMVRALYQHPPCDQALTMCRLRTHSARPCRLRWNTSSRSHRFYALLSALHTSSPSFERLYSSVGRGLCCWKNTGLISGGGHWVSRIST